MAQCEGPPRLFREREKNPAGCRPALTAQVSTTYPLRRCGLFRTEPSHILRLNAVEPCAGLSRRERRFSCHVVTVFPVMPFRVAMYEPVSWAGSASPGAPLGLRAGPGPRLHDAVDPLNDRALASNRSQPDSATGVFPGPALRSRN
jgi:hypothetical protein